MELIDSHCHLDDASFDGDRDRVLRRCLELGVSAIVLPAVRADWWPRLLALASGDPGRQPILYPTLGLHPVFLADHQGGDVDRLDQMLSRHPVVAVGEIGLDHYIAELDRARQRELFEAQLRLANKHDLPVILHVRKAHDEVLACLRRNPVRGGIVHAFNGSEVQARAYLDLGFKLGFGGMLTYRRSTRIRARAAELPLDALVLETDAPDMAVASHRGERNSPEYLPECLAALAEVRTESRQTLADRCSGNVREALRLA